MIEGGTDSGDGKGPREIEGPGALASDMVAGAHQGMILQDKMPVVLTLPCGAPKGKAGVDGARQRCSVGIMSQKAALEKFAGWKPH